MKNTLNKKEIMQKSAWKKAAFSIYRDLLSQLKRSGSDPDPTIDRARKWFNDLYDAGADPIYELCVEGASRIGLYLPQDVNFPMPSFSSLVSNTDKNHKKTQEAENHLSEADASYSGSGSVMATGVLFSPPLSGCHFVYAASRLASTNGLCYLETRLCDSHTNFVRFFVPHQRIKGEVQRRYIFPLGSIHEIFT